MNENVDRAEIWLEVTNVRRTKDGVELQFKGDKADREPVWWRINMEAAGYMKTGSDNQEKEDPDAAYRAIAEGLDKKRIVHAALGSNKAIFECRNIRIQYAESINR